MNITQQLNDGLVLRQATKTDIETLADFTTRIHENPALGESIRDLMCGDHPTTGVSNFVLVTDSRANNQIAAMAGLISQTWAYAGIPFDIGNPEFIATGPAYRRRGLMRQVMDGLHQISAARGHLAQAVLGLRWFYRQFGYEYTLHPGPSRRLSLKKIPALTGEEAEPYQIRRITEAELSLIAPLYQQQCTKMLVTNVLDEHIRRHDIFGYNPDSDLGDWTFAVVEPDGRFVGYYSTWGDPWGAFTIKELAVVEGVAYGAGGMGGVPPFPSPRHTPGMKPPEQGFIGVSLECILPTVLRFIQAQRLTYAAEFGDKLPSEITFELNETHAIYQLLETKLGQATSRQDWYMRVPDIPKFLRHISPILEQRLAASSMQNFSGELTISFYRDGLHLVFSQGKLLKVTDWQSMNEAEAFHLTAFPPLVFLKLLFGYRSLEELRYAYPDCWANDQDTLLLNILFPKQSSWLRQL